MLGTGYLPQLPILAVVCVFVVTKAEERGRLVAAK